MQGFAGSSGEQLGRHVMFGNFVNLNGIMSSESNTFFLERLMNNHDAFKAMGIKEIMMVGPISMTSL